MEKLSLLKQTDIFRNVRDADLDEIAAILEELHLKAGEKIFNKGETGNCMYIIREGNVRIHDGEYTLATLGNNEVLGELSVLDAETRSGSATCDDDCVIFKLDQHPFYKILSKDQQVLKGILKMLCRRIRALDAKSAQHQ